jgi:hypothetical protein
VTPSAYLVDVFSRFGVRAVPIANFVDPETARFRRRSPLRPVFLSNRNFQGLYNVPCVLRAFARIQARIPEARLIVIGDGPERASVHETARSLALRNVEFVGAVTPSAMGRWYDEADVYLNSSDIDNMPNSIIEAFACGLPVVTSRAGGIPYVVEHERNGLLVDCGDHDALAQQLADQDGRRGGEQERPVRRAEHVHHVVGRQLAKEGRDVRDRRRHRAHVLHALEKPEHRVRARIVGQEPDLEPGHGTQPLEQPLCRHRLAAQDVERRRDDAHPDRTRRRYGA